MTAKNLLSIVNKYGVADYAKVYKSEFFKIVAEVRFASKLAFAAFYAA